MIALLLTLGAAGAADLGADAASIAQPVGTTDEAALEVRRQGRRIYPWRLFDDLSVERRCTVDVTISERGRPASITPVDCPEALVEHTRRRVKRDRWEKPVPPGARARVEVVYVPPVDALDLPAPDYWRRRAHGACEARVAVAPDGAVRVKEASEGCGLEVAAWSPTPHGVLRGKTPEVCPVTLIVDEGRPRAVDLFRCDLRLWSTVRAGLARWTWPVTERPTPWTVLVQLDGPPAGDPSE